MTTAINQQKKFHPAFLVAIAVFLMETGSFGIAGNSAGIFYTTVSESLGVSYGQFTMYSTVMFVVQALAIPFAAKAVEKMKIRVLLPVCTIITGLSVMSMAFFNGVIPFYIVGALMGLCTSVTFWIAPFALMNRYFKKSVGLAIALAMCGTTLGGAIFTPVGSAFLSMDSFLFFEEGWRAGYFVLGIISVVVSTPLCFFIANRPEDQGRLPYGETGISSEGNANAPISTQVGVSKSVALKSTSFWMLLISISIAYLAGAIYYMIPSFVQSIEVPSIAAMAATVTSTAMVAAVIGKLGFGTLNDKIGPIGTMAIGFVAGLGTLLMYFFPTSAPIIMTGGFLFGMYYAFPVVFHPLLCRTIFGSRDYEKIYSILATVSAFCNAFGVSIWGFSVDIVGNYSFIMIAGGVCAIVSLITGIIAYNSGKKLVHTAE